MKKPQLKAQEEGQLDDIFAAFMNEVEVAPPGEAKKDAATSSGEDPAKLAAHLKSKDWQARHDACVALGELGVTAAAYVAALTERLGDRDAAVRGAARKAIQQVQVATEAAAAMAVDGGGSKSSAPKAKKPHAGATPAVAQRVASAVADEAPAETPAQVARPAEDAKARVQAMRRQQQQRREIEGHSASPPAKRQRASSPSSEAGDDSPQRLPSATKAASPVANGVSSSAGDVGDSGGAAAGAGAKESWEYIKKDNWGSGQFFDFNSF